MQCAAKAELALRALELRKLPVEHGTHVSNLLVGFVDSVGDETQLADNLFCDMLRMIGQVLGPAVAGDTGTATPNRPVHLLNVMGFRAEESPVRRRRVSYAANAAASNGRRGGDDWYPIHDWTVAQVRNEITTAGTRSHEANAAGMSRLSR